MAAPEKTRCEATYCGWRCERPRGHPGPHRNTQYGCFLEWLPLHDGSVLKAVT